MNSYTLKQLKDLLDRDLLACHTDFERSMVKAIGGKEIRECAQKLAGQRKLTNGELTIARAFGF